MLSIKVLHFTETNFKRVLSRVLSPDQSCIVFYTFPQMFSCHKNYWCRLKLVLRLPRRNAYVTTTKKRNCSPAVKYDHFFFLRKSFWLLLTSLLQTMNWNNCKFFTQLCNTLYSCGKNIWEAFFFLTGRKHYFFLFCVEIVMFAYKRKTQEKRNEEKNWITEKRNRKLNMTIFVPHYVYHN